ncbi:GTP-binding protein [Arcanobacterium buesumense]|uniref:ATP-binding cassette domain-containing protein n=1 Tax=Arcanobacterium buesumense TaxID=2722751 RepID=A0A6H2EKS1_9ACTO|nr:GTP-binding protein [Arcanobacterium buesumense]QJC21461.1 ATP-binding cassette domain-containing protein [Arcanobacterium buesumense]
MEDQQVIRVEGAHAIADRLERLQDAVAAGGQYFDPYVSARAQDDLRRTQERMSLGTDITVAALVGGTGSGKSSLFNAITGLNFADSGDIRPMTERATACTYGTDASALLDYLAVDHDRRIEYDSELTVGHEEFDRLVLIDLPDHDSVAVEHSVEVERLLPMVDILIWVLDPQKYADQVLHTSYLEKLTERAEVMVVALNQIDTVQQSQRQVLLDDVRKLLASDGLHDLPIVMTSALTGEGVGELAGHIRTAISRPSVAATTAAAELDAIGRRLRFNVGSGEADVQGSQRTDMIDRISRASGVGAAAESVRNAGRSLFSTAYVQPEKLGHSMSVAVRDSWMGFVRRGLPDIWQDAVVADVASAERLRHAVGNALKAVALPRLNRGFAWALSVCAAVVLVVGIVLGAVGLPFSSVGGRLGTVGVGYVIAIILWVVAKTWLRRRAGALAQQYEDQARLAVGEVFDETMVAGPAKVLDKHKTTRISLETFI